MRYARIFLLNFQQALVHRGLSFVWFLSALLDIGIILIFWFGVTVTTKHPINGWTFTDLSSYYLFALVANQLLMSHMEIDVAKRDIKEGNLVSFILKPHSYLSLKFYQESSWRVMAGIFGLLTLLFFVFILHLHILYPQTFLVVILSICIALLGFFIGFLFKMILGISAFWLTETRGLFEATDMVTVILLGNLMPLPLLPHWVEILSLFLPFSYIIYFPIVAFEGKLLLFHMLYVIGIQLFWIGTLYYVYKKLWISGIKKFSAVGQ